MPTVHKTNIWVGGWGSRGDSGVTCEWWVPSKERTHARSTVGPRDYLLESVRSRVAVVGKGKGQKAKGEIGGEGERLLRTIWQPIIRYFITPLFLYSHHHPVQVLIPFHQAVPSYPETLRLSSNTACSEYSGVSVTQRLRFNPGVHMDGSQRSIIHSHRSNTVSPV